MKISKSLMGLNLRKQPKGETCQRLLLHAAGRVPAVASRGPQPPQPPSGSSTEREVTL